MYPNWDEESLLFAKDESEYTCSRSVLRFSFDRFFTSRFSGKCFNCRTPGHRDQQCENPTDWLRAKSIEAVWLNRQNGKPADDEFGVNVLFCEMADALNETFSATTEELRKGATQQQVMTNYKISLVSAVKSYPTKAI